MGSGRNNFSAAVDTWQIAETPGASRSLQRTREVHESGDVLRWFKSNPLESGSPRAGYQGLLDTGRGNTVAKFKEFNIEVPQALIDLGFEDTSWHNDTCATMERKLLPGQVAEWPQLRAWVDFDDPSERELFCAKFGLELLANEEEVSNGEASRLYVGDDISALVECIKASEIAHGK